MYGLYYWKTQRSGQSISIREEKGYSIKSNAIQLEKPRLKSSSVRAQNRAYFHRPIVALFSSCLLYSTVTRTCSSSCSGFAPLPPRKCALSPQSKKPLSIDQLRRLSSAASVRWRCDSIMSLYLHHSPMLGPWNPREDRQGNARQGDRL